jgi:hypothetical protein
MTKLEIEITEYIKEQIDSLNGLLVCDLHNELFNIEYWCYGTYNAEQNILKHCSIFEALNIVKDYEIQNFGQCSTDLSNAENVCNMLVYILGEEILNKFENYRLNIDQTINQEICSLIQIEINNL